MISGTPVERVSSFKYLGVNISEDLTWTTHIQTQVKKARQRLYHLRQLRKFRVSPAILKTFYSGAIESVLTQCISVWYGNSSNQDCKALQRVVRLAERISGSTLPSLQVIYLKRCKSRAAKIIKDSNHRRTDLIRALNLSHVKRSIQNAEVVNLWEVRINIARTGWTIRPETMYLVPGSTRSAINPLSNSRPCSTPSCQRNKWCVKQPDVSPRHYCPTTR